MESPSADTDSDTFQGTRAEPSPAHAPKYIRTIFSFPLNCSNLVPVAPRSQSSEHRDQSQSQGLFGSCSHTETNGHHKPVCLESNNFTATVPWKGPVVKPRYLPEQTLWSSRAISTLASRNSGGNSTPAFSWTFHWIAFLVVIMQTADVLFLQLRNHNWMDCILTYSEQSLCAKSTGK